MSDQLDPLSVGVPPERIADVKTATERACRFNCDYESSCDCRAHELGRLAVSALDAQQARVEALLAALAKVRAHTSWVHPSDGNLADLTIGLLASIERIADEALASPPSVSERKD